MYQTSLQYIASYEVPVVVGTQRPLYGLNLAG